MRYKAIIFDMDGTIIDTHHIWREATKKLIERRGILYDADMEQSLEMRMRGMQIDKSCALLKKLFSLTEDLDILVQERSNNAVALYRHKACLIDGFPDFHKQAVNQQLSTGLATNADDATLAVSKETFKLETYFGNHIYNISHINNRGKPDPALFLHTAKQLAIDPEKCIVIEDSPHGIQAAKDAGMLCIAINTGGCADALNNSYDTVQTFSQIDLHRLLHNEDRK